MRCCDASVKGVVVSSGLWAVVKYCGVLLTCCNALFCFVVASSDDGAVISRCEVLWCLNLIMGDG